MVKQEHPMTEDRLLFRSVDDGSVADMLSDHLYESHGINVRAGTPDADVIARHDDDHTAHDSGTEPPGGWPRGWDDHEPDEFFISRWARLAAIPAAEAAPDAGLLDAEYVLGMMLEFQRLYGRLSKVPVEAVATMLRNAPAPASAAAPETGDL